ncbi:MAG: DUF6715 family protein [Lachnospiraceae bacterium]
MKKTVRIIVAVGIGACLILGYYYYLNHRPVKGAQGEDDNTTEIESIIEADLAEEYPKTPRAVVKFYNRILTCYYNEECSESELKSLAKQQLNLMDEELKANNPEDKFLKKLQLDIQDYKDKKRTISSSTVSGTDDVIYKTVDKRNCAYVTSSYFIKEDNSYDKTFQRYVLRKDEEGKWKILVFYMIEGEEKDE